MATNFYSKIFNIFSVNGVAKNQAERYGKINRRAHGAFLGASYFYVEFVGNPEGSLSKGCCQRGFIIVKLGLSHPCGRQAGVFFSKKNPPKILKRSTRKCKLPLGLLIEVLPLILHFFVSGRST